MVYDTAIIGAGPAGVSAGVYAARKQLKTLFVTKEWGGQSVVSPGIQNWIGTIEIAGEELAKQLKAEITGSKLSLMDVLQIHLGISHTHTLPGKLFGRTGCLWSFLLGFH